MFSDYHMSKEFRRRLFQIYNGVNQDIYGFGVMKLRIAFVEDMVLFRTTHNRVRALQALETCAPELKRSVDYELFSEFKRRIAIRLANETDLVVSSILRDYDPTTETAVTVVCVGGVQPSEAEGWQASGAAGGERS